MTNTQNTAYVKWRNGQDVRMQNTLASPFAESKFLSLESVLPAPEEGELV